MLKRTGATSDFYGTSFLRRRDLLHLLLPLVRVKLRLPTRFIIMQTMRLAVRNRSSLRDDVMQYRRLL